MWDDFLAAVALLFVIEGIMPFMSPSRIRKTLTMVSQMSDRALRIMGLASMLLGIVLLYVVK